MVSTAQMKTKDLELRKKYTDLINYGNAHPDKLKENLHRLRCLILLEGLPPEMEEEYNDKGSTKCSLRGTVWKLLLGIKQVDAERYISLIQRGPSSAYQKIRKDMPRTFMNDEGFSARVPQDKLSRCLNSLVHSCDDIGSTVSYVQGMNAICGAFLYVLPEVEAFHCFHKVATELCSAYLVPDISGVHTALKLMTKALEHVDPDLYSYLSSKGYHPELLTPPILSLGTATPPLDEVLHLWDFYFAFGVHMNVVCTVAQLVLMREKFMSHSSPCSLFRSLPPLDAQMVLSLSITIVRQLPSELYDLFVAHPTQKINVK